VGLRLQWRQKTAYNRDDETRMQRDDSTLSTAMELEGWVESKRRSSTYLGMR
jgi:hypothetical protein